MKKIALMIILVFAAGGFFEIQAQRTEQLTLKVGQQKKVRNERVDIKFVQLVEDSRCPINALCIHPGNAKIRIRISVRGRTAETFELNTNTGIKNVNFRGYSVKLKSLTPIPRPDVRINRYAYTAVLTVSKTND